MKQTVPTAKSKCRSLVLYCKVTRKISSKPDQNSVVKLPFHLPAEHKHFQTRGNLKAALPTERCHPTGQPFIRRSSA